MSFPAMRDSALRDLASVDPGVHRYIRARAARARAPVRICTWVGMIVDTRRSRLEPFDTGVAQTFRCV